MNFNNEKTATAIAHPNIAFIKYWGNRDEALNLPQNASLSMNLDGLTTRTTVTWTEALAAKALAADALTLNGAIQHSEALTRVSRHLDVLRRRLNLNARAQVDSTNNFPMGAGIASSASSFAALTLAAVAAAKVEMSERELTTFARIGSGSAARSIPTGFVEWEEGERHEDSFAHSIAAPDHWDIVDVIAVVSDAHKQVGSKAGHGSADSSDLQRARVAGAADRLAVCKRAIADRDFSAFADVVEMDSNLMHAVMMTSRPPLFYWLPPTLAIMGQVRLWRADGLRVCYTLDAGPNVHCICIREDANEVSQRLGAASEVMDVRVASVGGGAVVVPSSLQN